MNRPKPLLDPPPRASNAKAPSLYGNVPHECLVRRRSPIALECTGFKYHGTPVRER